MDYSPTYSAAGAADRVELRQVRRVPEIINDTFVIVRSHPRFFFRTLATLALSPMLVATAISMVVLFRSWSTMFDPYNSGPYGPEGFLTSLFTTFLTIPFLVIGYAMLVLVIHELVVIYDEKSPEQIREMRVRDVWDRVKGRVGWIIGTFLVWGLVLFIAIALVSFIPIVGVFAIPVIVVYTILYFPLRIYDRRGLVQSFVESSKLVSGSWWKTLGLSVMIYLLTIALTGIIFFPVIFAMFMGRIGGWDLSFLEDSPVLIGIFGIIYISIYTIGTIIITSLGMVAVILHYFNLTERKEARSLEERIPMIGADLAPRTPPTDDTGGFTDYSPSLP